MNLDEFNELTSISSFKKFQELCLEENTYIEEILETKGVSRYSGEFNEIVKEFHVFNNNNPLKEGY